MGSLGLAVVMVAKEKTRALVLPLARLPLALVRWCFDMTMHMHYHLERTPHSSGLVMSANLKVESTLTDRYQTTVPETVRRALKLDKRDKIRYSIRPNGQVVLTRAAQAQAHDPVLGEFLGFLARDIAKHPHRLQSVDSGLVRRIQSLVGKVEVNLDAPLSVDDE